MQALNMMETLQTYFYIVYMVLEYFEEAISASFLEDLVLFKLEFNAFFHCT